MDYMFPNCVKFVSNERQINKIREELFELHESFVNDGVCEHAAEECLDVIQACETLLRSFERAGIDVRSVRDQVLKKNKKRGYYDDFDCGICF